MHVVEIKLREKQYPCMNSKCKNCGRRFIFKKKGRRKPGERVEFVDEIVDAAVTSKS